MGYINIYTYIIHKTMIWILYIQNIYIRGLMEYISQKVTICSLWTVCPCLIPMRAQSILISHVILGRSRYIKRNTCLPFLPILNTLQISTKDFLILLIHWHIKEILTNTIYWYALIERLRSEVIDKEEKKVTENLTNRKKVTKNCW